MRSGNNNVWLDLVDEMSRTKEPVPEMKHGGNHHDWADYDLASEGMETAIADVEDPIDRYNLESAEVDPDVMMMSDDAPVSAPATKYGAEIKKDGGSVWDRERYSTSAKKYRRGGESLIKYQEKGEVKLTDLEKKKKHRSFTGEYYAGPLSSHEIQDFWCFECDNYTIHTNGGWREGMDPAENPEIDKWRSSKGYSVWDLLNFHYHTQMNIPYAVSELPEGMRNIDLSDRSTWEGKNYGYVREDSPNPMGTNGVPGHPYENESFFPKSKNQAHAMARDLRNIYPGVVIPYYFYKGEPYNIVEQDDIDKQQHTNRLDIANQRAFQLHDQIVKWFNDDTYLHEMGITDPKPGDIRNYLDKWLNAEYTYTDEFGNSTTLKDTDMPEFLKMYKKESGGVGLFDDIIAHYDDYYQQCTDGVYGCKGSPYKEHSEHPKPAAVNVEPLFSIQGTEDDEIDYTPTYDDPYGTGSALPPMDNRGALHLDDHLNIIYDVQEVPQKGFYVNGTWYPEGTHVLSEDKRTSYQRTRDKQIANDREKRQRLVDLTKWNTNYSLGLSRMDQNYASLDKLVDAPMTYGETLNYINSTMPSLNGAVYNGLSITGTLGAYTQPIKWLNNLSKINRLSKLKSLSTLKNVTSIPRVATNPITYGDALNVGYAAYGTKIHGPGLIENIKEGDGWGTVGHGIGLGLHYMGVPSTYKNLNRSFFGGKQFNRFPITTAGFKTEFPTIYKHNIEQPGLNSQFDNIYNNLVGPSIGNMPRYNMFGPSQNSLLKNVSKYEKNFFSPYTDVTKAADFMPNLIKPVVK
tara:strand:+ start:71 stop:2467 length:2397 start_codon:yes stop_codon:yes gene_type:complete